jgi:hypothetical protein
LPSIYIFISTPDGGSFEPVRGLEATRRDKVETMRLMSFMITTGLDCRFGEEYPSVLKTHKKWILRSNILERLQ